MKQVGIGAKLKSLRERAGYSAKRVSKQLGIAESTYRDWENGRAIKGEPYAGLAKIFGVTLSELLNEEVSEEKSHILESLRKMERIIEEIKTVL